MSMTLTNEVLRKYVREVFFETGTHDGGGVDVALACGFRKVYSCDRDFERIERARQRFPAEKVELFHGDSRQILTRVLPGICSSITFWLDAHDDSSVHEPTPLLGELSAIFGVLGRVGRNVILIDDLRFLGAKGTWGEGLSVGELLGHIRSLDESVTLAYEDNPVAQNDILVVQGTEISQ
jgi:hypothetical protein